MYGICEYLVVRILKHVPYTAPQIVQGPLRSRLPQDLHTPFRRSVQSVEVLRERRLSTPVLADQGDELAGHDIRETPSTAGGESPYRKTRFSM